MAESNFRSAVTNARTRTQPRRNMGGGFDAARRNALGKATGMGQAVPTEARNPAVTARALARQRARADMTGGILP